MDQAQSAPATMRQGPSQPKRDAFRLWPTSVSLVFLLEFYCSNFLEATTGVLGLKLFFLNAIFLILWLIIAIILTCYSLFRKRWRLALSIIASPLVAYALILSLHWSGITPERLRLEWNKAKYLQEISSFPPRTDNRAKCAGDGEEQVLSAAFRWNTRLSMTKAIKSQDFTQKNIFPMEIFLL